MKNLKHIFFDLDRTLWDFDTNVDITLREMYDRYGLAQYINSPEAFIAEYQMQNQRYWELYIDGKIKKEHLRTVRYQKTLETFGIRNKKMALHMGEDYIKLSPLQKAVFPHTHDVLAYLQKKYTLHIITNGFEEVQTVKIKASGIDGFFANLITSEKAGALKPHRKIFDYSLSLAGALPDECLMVGDEPEKDIKGALNVGMHAVYFNPSGQELAGVWSIQSLSELVAVL